MQGNDWVKMLSASRLGALGAVKRCLHTSPALSGSPLSLLSLWLAGLELEGAAGGGAADVWWGPEKAAGREVVGYGMNGDPSYSDREDNPFPAIRFRKDDDVIRALRDKEKGDWKALSLEDKKTRSSILLSLR